MLVLKAVRYLCAVGVMVWVCLYPYSSREFAALVVGIFGLGLALEAWGVNMKLRGR